MCGEPGFAENSGGLASPPCACFWAGGKHLVGTRQVLLVLLPLPEPSAATPHSCDWSGVGAALGLLPHSGQPSCWEGEEILTCLGTFLKPLAAAHMVWSGLCRGFRHLRFWGARAHWSSLWKGMCDCATIAPLDLLLVVSYPTYLPFTQ